MTGMDSTQIRIRATERGKKASITFADLCALEDRGREAGIDPAALVGGDTYVKHLDGRHAYIVKYIEV